MSKPNALAQASAQTRDELLAAGLRLLIKLPATAAFGHLTAAKIATEAGRTSGAFFHQWPTIEAYLQDFIGYVLRPELAVNMIATIQRLVGGIAQGQTFARAMVAAGRGVPMETATDPQSTTELLLSNRTLHDEEFRQRIAGHYAALDQGAAPVFDQLMLLLGRGPRPPFTAETIGAVCAAIAEGLSVRAISTPGFYPDPIFGWIILSLIPLLTRETGDSNDADEFVDTLPLHLSDIPESLLAGLPPRATNPTRS